MLLHWSYRKLWLTVDLKYDLVKILQLKFFHIGFLELDVYIYDNRTETEALGMTQVFKNMYVKCPSVKPIHK